MAIFAILSPIKPNKPMEVVSAYPNQRHRDVVLELLRAKRPDKTYIAQNPADNEREDGRRTS